MTGIETEKCLKFEGWGGKSIKVKCDLEKGFLDELEVKRYSDDSCDHKIDDYDLDPKKEDCEKHPFVDGKFTMLGVKRTALSVGAIIGIVVGIVVVIVIILCLCCCCKGGKFEFKFGSGSGGGSSHHSGSDEGGEAEDREPLAHFN